MPDYELEDLEIPDGSAPATRLQKKIERQKYKDEHPEVKPKDVFVGHKEEKGKSKGKSNRKRKRPA